MKIVIPCGGVKLPHAAPARDLYCGALFKSAMRWAVTVAQPADMRILSAKYGFVELDRVLVPYDVRFGSPHAISLNLLVAQAAALDWGGEDVLALGGVDYALTIRAVLPHARPLRTIIAAEMGTSEVGNMRGWFRQNAGRFPAA